MDQRMQAGSAVLCFWKEKNFHIIKFKKRPQKFLFDFGGGKLNSSVYETLKYFGKSQADTIPVYWPTADWASVLSRDRINKYL